jgi:hypothetical protein
MEHEHEDGTVHEHGPEDNGAYAMPMPQEPIPVFTAFLVVIHPDGTATGMSNLDTLVTPDHPASFNEMYGACAQVMKDITIMQTAQTSAQTITQAQMQMAQQAMQSQQDQALAKQIMMPNRAQRRN